MTGEKIIKTTLITLGVIIAVMLVIAVFFVIFILNSDRGLAIITQKTAYTEGQELNIKIKNYLKERVCLSSCYPYYVEEQKDGSWKSYEYISCPEANTAKYCLETNSLKAFQTIVPLLKNGLYRLSIPVCENCSQNQEFTPQKWFYSNIFQIN